MYVLVLKQLIVMMLIVVVSFFFSRRMKFGEVEQRYVSNLLLFVINPCLIFNSFNIPYNGLKMKQLLIMVAVSLAVHVTMTVVATIGVRAEKKAGFQRAYLDRLGIVFTNSGFIGIPLINGVFGAPGVFLLMGYLVVFNLYLWTYGDFMMTRRISIKKIITNPNVIAVFAGIALFCCPVKLPELVSRPIELIGGMNTAVSMILLGLLFAHFSMPSGDARKRYIFSLVKTSVLRLIISPLVILALLYGVSILLSGVPDARMMLFVVFIASLCPIGMSVSTFAVIYRSDAEYTGLLVSITSAACIVTVPLFVKLAEMLF